MRCHQAMLSHAITDEGASHLVPARSGGLRRNLLFREGVVTTAGWPIAHYVWVGNTRDSPIVTKMIKDLAGVKLVSLRFF